jgi:hypothetical protein
LCVRFFSFAFVLIPSSVSAPDRRLLIRLQRQLCRQQRITIQSPVLQVVVVALVLVLLLVLVLSAVLLLLVLSEVLLVLPLVA